MGDSGFKDSCRNLIVPFHLEIEDLCIQIFMQHNGKHFGVSYLINKEEQTYSNVLEKIQHIANMLRISLERQGIIINPDPSCIISENNNGR